MNDEYKVISEFYCNGKQMVTVRIGNAAHVMSQEEWHKIYGRNHQERWKTKIDWNRFVPRKQYKKKSVS
jgi:hypothetical protein